MVVMLTRFASLILCAALSLACVTPRPTPSTEGACCANFVGILGPACLDITLEACARLSGDVVRGCSFVAGGSCSDPTLTCGSCCCGTDFLTCQLGFSRDCSEAAFTPGQECPQEFACIGGGFDPVCSRNAQCFLLGKKNVLVEKRMPAFGSSIFIQSLTPTTSRLCYPVTFFQPADEVCACGAAFNSPLVTVNGVDVFPTDANDHPDISTPSFFNFAPDDTTRASFIAHHTPVDLDEWFAFSGRFVGDGDDPTIPGMKGFMCFSTTHPVDFDLTSVVSIMGAGVANMAGQPSFGTAPHDIKYFTLLNLEEQNIQVTQLQPTTDSPTEAPMSTPTEAPTPTLSCFAPSIDNGACVCNVFQCQIIEGTIDYRCQTNAWFCIVIRGPRSLRVTYGGAECFCQIP